MIEVIEAVAISIAEQNGITWDMLGDALKDQHRRQAEAAIQALIDSKLCNPDCGCERCPPCTKRRNTKDQLQQLLQDGD